MHSIDSKSVKKMSEIDCTQWNQSIYVKKSEGGVSFFSLAFSCNQNCSQTMILLSCFDNIDNGQNV